MWDSGLCLSSAAGGAERLGKLLGSRHEVLEVGEGGGFMTGLGWGALQNLFVLALYSGACLHLP